MGVGFREWLVGGMLKESGESLDYRCNNWREKIFCVCICVCVCPSGALAQVHCAVRQTVHTQAHHTHLCVCTHTQSHTILTHVHPLSAHNRIFVLCS